MLLSYLKNFVEQEIRNMFNDPHKLSGGTLSGKHFASEVNELKENKILVLFGPM